MNEIIDLTLCTKEILQNGTMQAKRNILSKLGSNLVWNEKELFVYNDLAINKLVEGVKSIRAENPEFEPKKISARKDENGGIILELNEGVEEGLTYNWATQKTTKDLSPSGNLHSLKIEPSLELSELRGKSRTSGKFSVKARHGHILPISRSLLRDQGSNLGHPPYTYPEISFGGGLYHRPEGRKALPPA